MNRGRLGPKGLHRWRANNSADRLTTPLVRRKGSLEPATWNAALDLIVERSRQTLDERGPLGMAFYNSGQLFLEDYDALAVLVRAGIGTPQTASTFGPGGCGRLPEARWWSDGSRRP